MSPTVTLTAGRVYRYVGHDAPACRGHRYRLLAFPTSVPSYQIVVLSFGLTGPDAGRYFVCTQDNFARRFEETTDEQQTQDAADESLPGDSGSADAGTLAEFW